MELNVKDLTVEINGKTILSKLSLDVKEGEFVSLLGSSGCGKSTLLKTIAGILPAKEGLIFLGGRDITKLAPHKRKAVIVFQDMRLFPHMTVAENVAFPLKMQGVSKNERLAAASEYLEMVQLCGFDNRRVSTLSGGQQQRVALARALCAKPSLLLLDEPFSALDENLRDEMRSLVRSLHDKTHMTTVLVTHDQHEALSLSDRMALMVDGEMLQTGSPREIYERPCHRSVADYFGDNIYVDGIVKDGVFCSACLSCPANVAGGEYSLLLRPSILEPCEKGSISMKLKSVSFRGADSMTVWELSDGKCIKKAFTGAIGCEVGDSMNWEIDHSKFVFFSR